MLGNRYRNGVTHLVCICVCGGFRCYGIMDGIYDYETLSLAPLGKFITSKNFGFALLCIGGLESISLNSDWLKRLYGRVDCLEVN